MFYLGPFGSPTSRERYNEVVAQWLANGRCWPAEEPTKAADDPYTVIELICDYWQHAQKYYVKGGQPTSEQQGIRCALRTLRKSFGRLEAKDFTALRLQELRQVWIDQGLPRSTINQHTSRIKRAFRWGVSREKVPPSTLQSLTSVTGLKKGRSGARETPPIQPVDERSIEQTLPHLPPVVADIVRLQRLMACRPSEVIMLRPSDVDRSGDIWLYHPQRHKTEHRGRLREIFIGPRGQAILRPYLLRPATAYCFSPAESEQQRQRQRRLARHTPLSCGNRPDTTLLTPCRNSASVRAIWPRACRQTRRAVGDAAPLRAGASAGPLKANSENLAAFSRFLCNPRFCPFLI
jgi:integrase